PVPQGPGKVLALQSRGLDSAADGTPELVVAGGRGDAEILATGWQLSVLIDNREIAHRALAQSDALSKRRHGLWATQPPFLEAAPDIWTATSSSRLLDEWLGP